MGCVASTDGSQQAKVGFSSPDDLTQNDKLEQQLLQERMQALYTFKILLLGAGESGKSTVVKQLRTIHNKKLSRDELATIADSLHQNVLDCIKALLYACHERFQIPLDDDYDQQTATQIATWEEGKRITPDFATSILRLYNSQAIRTAYDRRSEFWLLDSCSYYMKHLDRFASSGFMPNEEDCVMARIRTTGIVVSHLEQKLAPSEVRPGEPDTLKFEVVDVGGQRNERKKWIHCFDDVKAILFIESLAGYNQVLFEDCTKNRMIESLELFREITHRKGFEDTPIFLFLNKKDLFEQMVQQEDLGKTFPEYTGGKNLAPALEFIQNKFKEQLPPGKQVGFQVVTGVWKRDIKCSFEEVKKELMDRNRRQIENEKNKIRKDQRQYEKKEFMKST